MKKRGFSVIFDDDDHGEAARTLWELLNATVTSTEFWHCKFAMADEPGARIKELYELCGQAQNSIRWLEKPRDLFTHLLRREPRRYQGKEGTRYEVGNEKDLLRIREKADIQPVRLRVFIAGVVGSGRFQRTTGASCCNRELPVRNICGALGNCGKQLSEGSA